MKPVYSEQQFFVSKSRDFLPLRCYQCNSIFYKQKRGIQSAIKSNFIKENPKFCCRKCLTIYKDKHQIINCVLCKKEIRKRYTDMLKPCKNRFCSRSCRATYYNTHKIKGIRISNLEKWLQQELPKLYPNLEFHFNRKDAINSELDIYIPSLKLAFELNGIFHYEPIYGTEKLQQIQNNDSRKFQACLEKQIELCIIDTNHKYIKKEQKKQYLQIITNIIYNKMALPTEFESV